MLKRRTLLITTGITLLLVASGIFVFQKGIYTFLSSGVERVDTSTAKSILQNEKPILIDARTLEEFEVSHLEDAIRLEGNRLDNFSKNEPLLIYCTVGVRSNRVAKQLSDKGFTKVYEMKEGILGWANKELPLIDHTGLPTNEVHTYNKIFAPLLKNGTAIY